MLPRNRRAGRRRPTQPHPGRGLELAHLQHVHRFQDGEPERRLGDPGMTTRRSAPGRAAGIPPRLPHERTMPGEHSKGSAGVSRRRTGRLSRLEPALEGSPDLRWVPPSTRNKKSSAYWRQARACSGDGGVPSNSRSASFIRRSPAAGESSRPQPADAKMDDRSRGAIGMIGEPAVRLLGDGSARTVSPDASSASTARMYRCGMSIPHQQVRVGSGLVKLDRALPVGCRVGVGEHLLGRVGRRQPCPQLLAGASGRSPVAGRLRGQRLVPRSSPAPRRCVRAARPARPAAARRPSPRPATHAAADAPHRQGRPAAGPRSAHAPPSGPGPGPGR